MKRIVMVEVDVQDEEHLRRAARAMAYAAWAVVGDQGQWNHQPTEVKPVVMVARTQAASTALRSCFDALPPATLPEPAQEPHDPAGPLLADLRAQHTPPRDLAAELRASLRPRQEPTE